MSNRFKFRIYSFLEKSFYFFSIGDGEDGYPQGLAGGVSEIQQYTGLNDKNNIEVYEGDILEFSDHIDEYKIGYVGFTAGSFYVNFLDDTDEEIAFLTTKDAKVIGNIFETPQLLK